MAYIGNSQGEECYSRNVQYCLFWMERRAVATARRIVFILLDQEVVDILGGFSLMSSFRPVGIFEILAVGLGW